MEYCPGGELLEKVADTHSHFGENEAGLIMQDIIRAINHCHSQNIAH